MKPQTGRAILAAMAAILALAGAPVTQVSAAVSGETATAAAGYGYSLAVKNDGSLWAWGRNADGELGDGTTKDHSTPEKIMSNVVSVSAALYYAAAIKTDGSLWVWGQIPAGKPAKAQTTPIKIMDQAAMVSVGNSHAMVIKTDGSLWAWGRNESGQLGDGTTASQPNPAAVKLIGCVAAVSAGDAYTLAIKDDGSLWAWGSNQNGALGDGTTKDHFSPIQVMRNVAAVSAGRFRAMAVKTDGSLWAWGKGMLGDGTADDHFSPEKIMDKVARVSTGDYLTMAVKTDGSLWAWGGAGTSGVSAMKSVAPLKITDQAAAAGAGFSHAVAVKSDGSLWASGDNSFGQLGDGTAVTRLSPVKIMDGVKLPGKISVNILTAVPTSAAVYVNGKKIAFDAYTINGNNYFKLRDLATVLSGTKKQFSVGWDAGGGVITLVSGQPYKKAGGEMAAGTKGGKTPLPTQAKITLDGKAVSFTAYTIGGSNYFLLRDIGKAFNFGVEWDAARNAIVIDTGKGYAAQ